MAMRAAVEQYLYLLDQTFDGNEEHSLLANLRDVTADDWTWLPPGGGRSIRDLVGHVGSCYYVYENHAFGDATLTYVDGTADPPVLRETSIAAMAATRTWLAEGYRRLRASVAALGDDALPRPRMTNWGAPAETRWIIAVMIQHTVYHAGEINHLRALRQGTDRWAWEEG